MKPNILVLLFLFVCLLHQSHAQLHWIKYTGELPANAVIGGQENGVNLAVCRGKLNEANHSGKVVSSSCNVGWGGKEKVLTDFDILVNKGGIRLTWESMNRTIPPNAVEAGIEKDKRIIVGQAVRAEDGSVHPGKIFGKGRNFICNYGYGGVEIVEKINYKVLVATPQLEWVAYNGVIPDNAVTGGYEKGSSRIVCRAIYNDAVHPGKVVAENCNIGWGGKEIEVATFEILINGGVPIAWELFKGSPPSGSVQAGTENGKSLYVGQATRSDGSMHSGKIFGDATVGYIFNYGYGGEEITAKSNFRILVEH